MTKNEIAEKVAKMQQNKMPVSQAQKIVSDVFEVIADALVARENVVIADFAKFECMKRKATTGTNFHTGGRVQIPAKNGVKLKLGKELKRRLNK